MFCFIYCFDYSNSTNFEVYHKKNKTTKKRKGMLKIGIKNFETRRELKWS